MNLRNYLKAFFYSLWGIKAAFIHICTFYCYNKKFRLGYQIDESFPSSES